MKQQTKIINRILLGAAVLTLYNVALTSTAQAQVYGAATTYDITINKVELCESISCTSPVTLGNGATSFDIASASIGESMGSYASLDSVPKGSTISHIRITIDRSISIAGSTIDPGNVGGTCGTDSSDNTSATTAAGVGIIGAGGTAQTLVVPDINAFFGSIPSAAMFSAENATLINATELQFIKALPTAFTMGDVPPVIDISFDTATGVMVFDDNGGVAGGNCSMIPGIPTVTISVQEF